VVQSSHEEEVEIIVEHDGEQETLRGVRVGKSPYVQLHKQFHAFHPAVKAAVRNAKDALGVKIGKGVKDVWMAVGSEESGDLIQRGQNLVANVRIKTSTGGFIVAAGVALGAIVAVEAIRRSHQEP
jgi:hypothetical protein